MIDDNQLKLGR